jgi:hypothetical protein
MHTQKLSHIKGKYLKIGYEKPMIVPKLYKLSNLLKTNMNKDRKSRSLSFS